MTLLARGGVAALILLAVSCGSDNGTSPSPPQASIDQGRDVFRYDTFGDERFWTDILRMHEVIEGAVDPTHRPLRGPEGGRRRAAAGHPADRRT